MSPLADSHMHDPDLVTVTTTERYRVVIEENGIAVVIKTTQKEINNHLVASETEIIPTDKHTNQSPYCDTYNPESFLHHDVRNNIILSIPRSID